MEELAKQVQQKIGLNDEIISSLKEFFGTTLSDFLKVYRDFENAEDEKLKNILKRQDTIYQKLHELMKASSLRFANSKEDSLSKLTEINGRQQRFISSIREFFLSNSKFMAAYRKKSPELYFQMETLLDKQEVIFQKLESIIKPNI
jgi:hypothetical protein